MANKQLWLPLVLAGFYFFAALFPIEIEPPSAIFVILATICRTVWLIAGISCVLQAYDMKKGKGK